MAYAVAAPARSATSEPDARDLISPGDLNGFLGLVVDNLSIMAFIAAALIGIFQFPADIVFTLTPADATALHDDTLDLSVGFMRGQVKMAGDFGALLRFLPLTAGADPAVPVADLLPG